MYYLIVNKLHLKGKRARKLDAVKAVFDRAGLEYEILETDHSGHAAEYAKTYTSGDSENTIIAMGGDGTLHEILNGFVNFEKNSLALIPFGTGNDFAEIAGIPRDVKAAAEIIAFRAPTPIDFIQFSDGLRSINAVGMGLDVDVLKRVYTGDGSGKGKYLRSLLKTVFGYKGIPFTVEYNGIKEDRFGMIAAIGNGRQIGGGIKVFPEARIDDGYLDLLVVDFISRRKLLSALFKLMRGKVNKIKEATAIRVKSAKITTSEPEFSIQAEGELYDNRQIDACVVSGKLKFYL